MPWSIPSCVTNYKPLEENPDECTGLWVVELAGKTCGGTIGTPARACLFSGLSVEESNGCGAMVGCDHRRGLHYLHRRLGRGDSMVFTLRILMTRRNSYPTWRCNCEDSTCTHRAGSCRGIGANIVFAYGMKERLCDGCLTHAKAVHGNEIQTYGERAEQDAAV